MFCSMKVVSVAVVWTLSIYLAGAAQIIGGHEATPHSRPYMAYLSMVRGTKCVACGGFLVRNDFIMTAAHCNADNITAILGAHNVVRGENSQQIIPVAKSFPFPDFCPRELDDDIMLLKLRWNATLNSAVGVLPLPKKVRDVRVGRSCSVAGWGAMDTEGEKPSPTLQEVNVTVVRRLCAQTWGRQFNEYKVCAAGPLKGGCSGDSGAPLVCRGVAVGILSFGGKPCGYLPNVFTKVAMYLDWARDMLANN